jgi:predicted esterase YcpF (UPF0227 family)
MAIRLTNKDIEPIKPIEKPKEGLFIVYFHGWGHAYNEAKAKILGKFNDEVYYPNIDYQNNRNLIHQYVNEIHSGRPTLLVGTSMGAYLAYHISNVLRCPALIINPTFFYKSGAEFRPSSSYLHNVDMNKDIILSGKDEELDHKRNIKFLKEFGFDNQIKVVDGLTHQIPLDVFENYFSEFREKYKDYKPESKKEESYEKEYKKDDWEEVARPTPTATISSKKRSRPSSIGYGFGSPTSGNVWMPTTIGRTDRDPVGIGREQEGEEEINLREADYARELEQNQQEEYYGNDAAG